MSTNLTPQSPINSSRMPQAPHPLTSFPFIPQALLNTIREITALYDARLLPPLPPLTPKPVDSASVGGEGKRAADALSDFARLQVDAP